MSRSVLDAIALVQEILQRVQAGELSPAEATAQLLAQKPAEKTMDRTADKTVESTAETRRKPMPIRLSRSHL